jgi:hypothetical protein
VVHLATAGALPVMHLATAGVLPRRRRLGIARRTCLRRGASAVRSIGCPALTRGARPPWLAGRGTPRAGRGSPRPRRERHSPDGPRAAPAGRRFPGSEAGRRARANAERDAEPEPTGVRRLATAGALPVMHLATAGTLPRRRRLGIARRTCLRRGASAVRSIGRPALTRGARPPWLAGRGTPRAARGSPQPGHAPGAALRPQPARKSRSSAPTLAGCSMCRWCPPSSTSTRRSRTQAARAARCAGVK